MDKTTKVMICDDCLNSYGVEFVLRENDNYMTTMYGTGYKKWRDELCVRCNKFRLEQEEIAKDVAKGMENIVKDMENIVKDMEINNE